MTPSVRPAPQSLRILWLDDQPDVSRTLSSLLEELHPEIVYCQDGERAFDLVMTDRFDLLILDLCVPPGEWGGLWLLENVVETLGAVAPPVLILSGEGSQLETIKAMRLGADYVTKEQALSELAARVAELSMIGASTQDETWPLREVVTETLVEADEDQHLEKKQTARFNVRKGAKDERMEDEVVDAIAALWNSDGGVVLVGVEDRTGRVFGIEEDAKLCGGGRDGDAFLGWVANTLLRGRLQVLAAFVRVRLDVVAERLVCRIDVPRGFSAAFVGDRLPVRIGNATHVLAGRDLVEYSVRRFPQLP
jgi:DNA-binding response OmpR family regulator